uniref:Peptidase M14 domain-containing protein n=1 Tax=Tetranychus urticae TaxID=32264 RepID=T1KB80_TETUR
MCLVMSSTVVISLTLLSLMVFIVAITSNPVNYKGYSVISVIARTRSDVDFINNLTIDQRIDYWFPSSTPNQPIKLLLNQDSLQKVIGDLLGRKLTVKVEIDDLGRHTSKQNINANGEIRTNYNQTDDTFFQSYARYDVMVKYLDGLVTKYPNKIVRSTIGQSFEKRNLTLVRIGNSIQRFKRKPIIYIQGGSHAREWISPATLIYLITTLTKSKDRSITKLTHFFEYWFLPVVNPDGYEYTHTHNRLWRKTRSRINNEPCIGVDPNRNFGYFWKGGVDNDPCSETYSGRKPFSEPEVASIAKLIHPNASRIKAFLDFHSFDQSWLIPYGFDSRKPKDFIDMERIAKKSVDALASIHGTNYSVGNKAQLLYPAFGLADDWAKGCAKIKYSFCIELRDKGEYGFLLPANEIIPK